MTVCDGTQHTPTGSQITDCGTDRWAVCHVQFLAQQLTHHPLPPPHEVHWNLSKGKCYLSDDLRPSQGFTKVTFKT